MRNLLISLIAVGIASFLAVGCGEAPRAFLAPSDTPTAPAHQDTVPPLSPAQAQAVVQAALDAVSDTLTGTKFSPAVIREVMKGEHPGRFYILDRGSHWVLSMPGNGKWDDEAYEGAKGLFDSPPLVHTLALNPSLSPAELTSDLAARGPCCWRSLPEAGRLGPPVGASSPRVHVDELPVPKAPGTRVSGWASASRAIMPPLRKIRPAPGKESPPGRMDFPEGRLALSGAHQGALYLSRLNDQLHVGGEVDGTPVRLRSKALVQDAPKLDVAHDNRIFPQMLPAPESRSCLDLTDPVYAPVRAVINDLLLHVGFSINDKEEFPQSYGAVYASREIIFFAASLEQFLYPVSVLQGTKPDPGTVGVRLDRTDTGFTWTVAWDPPAPSLPLRFTVHWDKARPLPANTSLFSTGVIRFSHPLCAGKKASGYPGHFFNRH